MKLNLTQAGKDMILQCVAGSHTMTIVSIAIGNGDDGTDTGTMSNPLLEIPMKSIERKDDYVTLTGSFNNSRITDGFRQKELGVYATYEKDGSTVKALLAYGYVDDKDADLIPANADSILETTMQVQVFVGAVKDVSAIINDSMVTVSKAEFEAHTSNNSNPHNVTKEQVGLGNVENVSPGNMEIDYEASSKPAELVSKEKLATALSKVAGTVKAFIEHLKAKNPHGVTAKDVGAASETHTHGVSDITKGILSVARGGTGVSSMDELKIALQNNGITKVVIGEYRGTGTSGSDGANSMTFTSTPKLLFIKPLRPTEGGQTYTTVGGVTALWGVRYNWMPVFGNTMSGVCLEFTWQDNTVNWYGDTTPAMQLNDNTTVYRYIAIL